MEFLAGEDLAQRLARTGPDGARRAGRHHAARLLGGGRGASDGDHPPRPSSRRTSSFLEAGPRGVEPKVLDFGISKAADTNPGTLTGTGMIGTPFYFAPEQIMDARSAGPASDQYALGAILYECSSPADAAVRIGQHLLGVPVDRRRKRGAASAAAAPDPARARSAGVAVDAPSAKGALRVGGGARARALAVRFRASARLLGARLRRSIPCGAACMAGLEPVAVSPSRRPGAACRRRPRCRARRCQPAFGRRPREGRSRYRPPRTCAARRRSLPPTSTPTFD